MRYLGRNTKEGLLIKKYIKSGNEHVFYYWNTLTDKEKDLLMCQLTNIKLKKIEKLFKIASEPAVVQDFTHIAPAECLTLEERRNDAFIREAGINALKSGEVAFLTVAGGQASRLGYEHPKGCFKISPIGNKSLFQIFAEKIRFYSQHYAANFKWFIMTSEDNYAETKDFFAEHGYFELDKRSVVFFKQGMLPTLTTDGKLILRDSSQLFMNPDGHGGILSALIKIGLIDNMINDGIKYLSYFQVDNPLINMADPYVIGYHIVSGSQVTTKVIKKAYPEEKLGSVVADTQIKKNMIIEYSDMTPELMNEKDEKGQLKYLMGSIGIHVFNTDFIKKITKHLPIHVAYKKVPGLLFGNALPEQGELDALKFETFVFDTIPFAKRSGFFETSRDEEFFPLKNATGHDSIETCVAGQIALHRSWLIEAGYAAVEKAAKVEISPLFAPDREIFLSKVKECRQDIADKIAGEDGVAHEIYIS